VKNFGLNLGVITNNIGFDLGLTADYGFGYELPYYAENMYHVWAQNFNALIGGKSHFTISLFFFRVTVFADVIGAKFSPSLRAKFDVINYNEVCVASDWELETLKVVITT
jgi:hypothetical protein